MYFWDPLAIVFLLYLSCEIWINALGDQENLKILNMLELHLI